MAGLFMVKQNISIGEYPNPMLNVFGFFSTLPVVDELNNLLNTFEAAFQPVWEPLCNSIVQTVSLECYELNTTNYAVHVPTTPWQGISGGDAEAPFVSWSFKLQRTTVGQRSGGKRVGPMSVGDYVGRVPIAGRLSLLADYAAVYGAPLTIGAIDTWFPVILERPVAPSTVWGQHGASGAYFESVSTQNTRKR